MTQPPNPADQHHRDRILRGLDENLFVEAGAGTGKTTALVGRIVALIASGKAEMSGLAAITFTEAAAAELRDRVRQELEKEAANDARDEASRGLCRQAAAEIGAASIQTLHSFAQSLLRALPLEAGLPPGFELLDPIEADLRFQDAWDEWLDNALESEGLGPALARALHLGLDLGRLRAAATAMNQDYDLVAKSTIADAPSPALTVGRKLKEAVTEVRGLLPLARNGGEDALYRFAVDVVALAERLPPEGTDSAAYERALVRMLGNRRISTPSGRQGDWDKEPLTGVNGCKLLKDLLQELNKLREEEIAALRTAAYLPALEAVRKFVVDLAQRRKDAGLAMYHDLLVWARDMLRDNHLARERFQRRFQHILVDEFQDTDPIQVEIAFFLAGDPDDDAARHITDWQAVTPVPGKLFMVGDPKQSIYRFRRADITTMAHARNHLTLESTPLQQNFRSRQSIITWVNHVFSEWMGGDNASGSGPVLQADYHDLAAWWGIPDNDDDTLPSAVHWLGANVAESADEARRLESQAVAGLALEVREGRWQVRDEASGGLRDAAYRDICVLMPTRTGLGDLEQALEDKAVPYRIESESIVLGTEDVRELLNCLRAIDSPGDQVALVAALRSSAFACSDVELLQFAEDGGRFDYQRPGPARGPVADALAALRTCHDESGWLPPDECIERFIRERRLVELSFDRRRPRERWRRLRYVVEQARAFMRAGGSSLRGFLDWVERQVEERARTVESPAPETDEDCVRIMTVHAAKGLEFPVVVLTGLGAARRQDVDSVIVNRTTGQAEVQLGSGDLRVSTPGYAAASLVEKVADEAEEVRLTYVACTRARDHLVVSLFRSKQRSDSSRAAKLEALCADRPELWHKLNWQRIAGLRGTEARTTTTPAAPVGEYGQERASWQKQRDATIEAASRVAAAAVTAIAQGAKEQAPSDPVGAETVTAEKEEGGDGETSYRRGRAATNLGRAVHAVLQSVDLLTGEGLEEISHAQALAEGIRDRDKEVAELCRNAIESGTVRGLRDQVDRGEATYYREVFVSAWDGNRLVEGFIDLLIDGPDGLTIVDYKTDRLTAKQVQELGPQYEVQLGLYAWALQEIAGKQVQKATLLFLRPQEERSFHDVGALVRGAMAAKSA